LKPTEADFAQWLRDAKKLGPRNILNKEILENEYKREPALPKNKRLKTEDNVQELFKAIKNNDVEKAREIINERTVNLDAYDEDKFAPLHLAVARNQQELVIMLLENGANSNIKDSEGNTPLHFAAEQNNLELLKPLVNSENINAVNEYN